MSTIIEAKNLTKKYGEFTAVDNLSLKVCEGEIFGLLGPNGAGKTTTIMMLAGLIDPTTGSAIVAGFDVVREPRKVKRVTGYLHDRFACYDNLTAKQNLDFYAQLNDIPKSKRAKRIDTLLEAVGLSKWKDVKVGKFSRGMRQRLGIAQALINEPKIVFLDEPTAGLDPQGTREVRMLIQRLCREERLTVVVTSHILPEVEQLCSRIGIMKDGKLIAVDTFENLVKLLTPEEGVLIRLELNKLDDKLMESIEDMPGIRSVNRDGNELIIHADHDLRENLAATIAEAGSLILTMHIVQPRLEEVFLKVYGRGWI
ncbi:ABC transporter ATP-binding protein [Candidatus Bathyarchaeota archaeon]|nr:MAG: ABC transporter ATP-binding protein [Candidatus Bathyarchaeota archaeon]